MNIAFICPGCQQIGEISNVDPQTVTELHCPHCRRGWDTPQGAWQEGSLRQCLVCPTGELYVRKDFSQRLGVAIIAIGFIVASIFWYYRLPMATYGVLFATALLDVILYFAVGNVLQCYRCQAQYRGLPGLEHYDAFDLETHEKHRQQLARLASVQPIVPPNAASSDTSPSTSPADKTSSP
jgi:hypothetical protein